MMLVSPHFAAVFSALLPVPGGHADPVVPILLTLVFLTLGAAFGGRLMGWIRQPAVLGELLVGIAAGNLGYVFGNRVLTVLREGDSVRRIAEHALANSVNLPQAVHAILPPGENAARVAAALGGLHGLSYVSVYSFVDLLSRVAILVLLFLVGLETNLGEMRRVGRSALQVAVIGVVLPMLLGLGVMRLLQPSSFLARDLFVGGILTATSVGITARVLRDLGQERRDESRIILGAAVIDDVLSFIVLAIVSGLAVRGSVSLLGIAVISFKAAAFLAGSLGIGVWLAPRLVRRLAGAGIQNLKLLFGWSFAFFLAWLADLSGLAAIVGAFAAGMILNDFFDRELEGLSLRALLSPVESLIVPLFFVWMGLQVKLETLFDSRVLLIGAALTVVAVAGKMAAGLGCPRGHRLAVGIGMIPRGEVGLIFAGIGKSIGVVEDGLFSAVVVLVMVTTLLAPVLLRLVFAEKAAPRAAGSL